jgi:uncharacterized protein (DUF305 family)
MKGFTLVALAFLVAAASADSVAQSAHTHMGAEADPADKALMESMQTMMKDMDVRMTGNPDRDFVNMMLAHHKGAVSMAEVELKYGHDPKIIKLAQDIVAAQEKEIQDMLAWLAQTGK